MRNLEDEMFTGDIKSAILFATVVKWLKVTLAIAVLLAYFTGTSWLIDVIVISVVASLILPLGFFDVFIQRLLEYNTRKLESRQILNATEANRHFEQIYKKLDG